MHVQCSWDLTAPLWTLCAGLTIILLSSIIIGNRWKFKRTFIDGAFTPRKKKLDRFIICNVGKQESLTKIQMTSPRNEKTCVFSCDYSRCQNLQSSRNLAPAEPSMDFDNSEPAFQELASDQPFSQSAIDVEEDTGKNIPNNKNSELSCDAKVMLVSTLPVECIKIDSADDTLEMTRNSDKCTGSFPRKDLERGPKISSDVHRGDHVIPNGHLPMEQKNILPTLNRSTSNISTTSKDINHAAVSTSNSYHAEIFKKNEMTQTSDVTHSQDTVFFSKGTMTDQFSADSSVSTHSKPCRLVRHYSTSTSGPFMKKLRRAHRLLVEAQKTSRCDRVSSAVKWRKVLNRYKHKMQSLTTHLAKRDEMMGGTSSRITVLRGEIKDALLAVRSTKERLTTQCKLNSALMDVIESKSDNPTYGADLYPPGSNHKQDQRGP